MILRRTTLLKCVAAGLVLLSVAPCTAPLSTYDLGGTTHATPVNVRTSVHDDSLIKKVASESHLAGVPARQMLSPFLDDAEAGSVAPTSHIVRRHALHSILRL